MTTRRRLLRVLLLAALWALPLVFCQSSAVAEYVAGDIARTNFGFINRYRWTNDNAQVFAPGSVFRLNDFDGRIVFFIFFDVWCDKCQSGIGQTSSSIRDWYRTRRGTLNGLPVVWVPINMENAPVYQAQTDTFLDGYNTTICGNDYTATTLRVVHDLFAPPGIDTRPVFVAINCISNSLNRGYREVLLKEYYGGGGPQDFSASVASWRNVLDAVQAPAPTITNFRYTDAAFEFRIPAQRGRTNRIQSSADFVDWITLTNVSGTNASVLIRDTDITGGLRFYRVLRQ